MLKLKAFIYIVMLNGYNYWLKLSNFIETSVAVLVSVIKMHLFGD